MDRWVVIVVGLAAFMAGVSGGVLLGFYWAGRHYDRLLGKEVAGAERERERADNAIDALSHQMRGEPISVAAVARERAAVERSYEEQAGLDEMFAQETSDKPGDEEERIHDA